MNLYLLKSTLLVGLISALFSPAVSAQESASEAAAKMAFAARVEAYVKACLDRDLLPNKASPKRDALTRQIEYWQEDPKTMTALKRWGTKAGDYRALFLQERRKACYYLMGYVGDEGTMLTKFSVELVDKDGQTIHRATSNHYDVPLDKVMTIAFDVDKSLTPGSRNTFEASLKSVKVEMVPMGRTRILDKLHAMDRRVFGRRVRARLQARKGRGRRGQKTVDRGLAYLANTQNPDGSWNAHLKSAPRVEATAKVLLAFLAAGHTGIDGDHKAPVQAGLSWLIEQQDKEGQIGASMKAHAMATTVLSEAFETGNRRGIKMPQRAALHFLLCQQRKGGGWGSTSNPPLGDTVSTTWAIMAAASARASGSKIGSYVFEGAVAALDALTDSESGQTAYRSLASLRTPKAGEPSLAATTAMAGFTRFFCRQKGHDARLELAHGVMVDAGQNLNDAQSAEDLDFLEFGTQTMYLYDGEEWKDFNRMMETAVIDRASEDGSWSPRKGSEKRIGIAQSTAIATLSLTVYYRYGSIR